VNKDEFFARQEKRTFPLPKKLKPYIKTSSASWGDKTITLGLKASGTGRIQLFEGDNKAKTLYIQRTNWQELDREGQSLKSILLAENKPSLNLTANVT